MLEFTLSSTSYSDLLLAVLQVSLAAFGANIIYNLYFHPLAHIPGPWLCRATGIPSWYHAMSGKRHIWLWQLFQVYGSKIRPEPGSVIFCDPEAFPDIYGWKPNVRRSRFYTAWRRSHNDINTFNSIDVALHNRKRRMLNLSFTEKSIRSASSFIVRHVDRWNELLIQDAGTDWTESVDFSEKVDALVFDVMGDLAFGRSFGIKEPGDNPLKTVPQSIAEYMKFYYPITRSPFLGLVLWLKPRGLDKLFNLITPPHIKAYYQFIEDSVTQRLALQKEQVMKPERERRLDMFHYLCEAKDPETGRPAYDENELRGEANLLIVAGSDTTSVSLSGIFFYLSGDDFRRQKLVDELQTTFASANEITYGEKLTSCIYLRACIDEGMRLAPFGPSELPREVLPGGAHIMGEYYPAGTIVGTAFWASSRNEDVYGDPNVFRPERWIVDAATNWTKEDVARLLANFHPFSAGPWNCVGKNLAMTEILITVARTLYRFDMRRGPGPTLGGGSPQSGWGARNPEVYQLNDAFISLRKGPLVQFRQRSTHGVDS